MANFLTSYKITESNEAGYTVDNGGPTYKGIAFNSWRTDPLVKKIVAIVAKHRPVKNQIIRNPQLDQLIVQFYSNKYWAKMNGDAIDNQVLADFIYDFAVNSITALPRINQAMGLKAVDLFTAEAIDKLNQQPALWYTVILNTRKNLYKSLAMKNPKFLKNGTYKGWINRLKKFPESI